MFITEKERRGTYYLEFQLCTSEMPVKDGKTDLHIVEPWQADSLLLDADAFDVFYPKYESIFSCALFPNGGTGFDYCGINYYNPKKTKHILNRLSPVIAAEYSAILPWLRKAVRQNRGFYILGL